MDHYKAKLIELQTLLDSAERKALEIGKCQGTSLWLTTLPLEDENLVLNKQEFFDAMCMRYGWVMKRLPSRSSCNANFSIEHMLSSHLGGFIIQQHNNI